METFSFQPSCSLIYLHVLALTIGSYCQTLASLQISWVIILFTTHQEENDMEF